LLALDVDFRVAQRNWFYHCGRKISLAAVSFDEIGDLEA
jgi:hypothetical protein